MICFKYSLCSFSMLLWWVFAPKKIYGVIRFILVSVACAKMLFPAEAKVVMKIAQTDDDTDKFEGLDSFQRLKEVDLNETPTVQQKRLRSRMDTLQRTGISLLLWQILSIYICSAISLITSVISIYSTLKHELNVKHISSKLFRMYWFCMLLLDVVCFLLTVEMGRRYFPNSSLVIDKLLEDDIYRELCLDGVTPDEQKLKRLKFCEMKQKVHAAYNRDKAEFCLSGLSSSSSSWSRRKLYSWSFCIRKEAEFLLLGLFSSSSSWIVKEVVQ